MDVNKAIADLQAMRQSHIDWATYFKAHPSEEARYVATGEWDTAAEHERLVAQYDNAIACLRGTM